MALFTRFAMEHATEEARAKYLKEHSQADPKNHTVKKNEPAAKKDAPGELTDEEKDKVGDKVFQAAKNASPSLLGKGLGKKRMQQLGIAFRSHAGNYAFAILDPKFLAEVHGDAKKMHDAIEDEKDGSTDDEINAINESLKTSEEAFRRLISKEPGLKQADTKAIDRAAKAFAAHVVSKGLGL